VENQRSVINKETILKSLKYFVGAAVGTMAVMSLWPWYLKGLEKHDASRSLVSIKNAGQAIKAYETEWNKLPPRNNWVNSCKSYGQVTQDPTYTRLTGEDQPENPGWAMNSRINLTIGRPEELAKNIKSSDFPKDAVLLGPSYNQEFFPQRNGELPLQQLSKDNKTPTQHGLRLGSTKHHVGVSGLYMLNDGSVSQLSLENAAELLKIRPIPPSKRSEVEKNIAYSDEVPWEPSLETRSEGGKIILKKGEVSTPLIPLNDKDLTITLKTSAEEPLNFLLNVEYFNQYKFPVNVKTKDGKLPMEAKLVKIYAGGHYLETDAPVSTRRGDTIGFNPSYGFADPVVRAVQKSEKKDDYWSTQIVKTDANFTKGTTLTWARDLSQEFKEKTGPEPKVTRIVIQRDKVPEGTAFISLRIKNNITARMTIEGVKVSRN